MFDQFDHVCFLLYFLNKLLKVLAVRIVDRYDTMMI